MSHYFCRTYSIRPHGSASATATTLRMCPHRGKYSLRKVIKRDTLREPHVPGQDITATVLPRDITKITSAHRRLRCETSPYRVLIALSRWQCIPRNFSVMSMSYYDSNSGIESRRDNYNIFERCVCSYIFIHLCYIILHFLDYK